MFSITDEQRVALSTPGAAGGLHPTALLGPAAVALLEQLAGALTQAEYRADRVAERLGATADDAREGFATPSIRLLAERERCGEAEPLDTLVGVFQLGMPMVAGQLRRALVGVPLEELLRLGVLEPVPGGGLGAASGAAWTSTGSSK